MSPASVEPPDPAAGRPLLIGRPSPAVSIETLPVELVAASTNAPIARTAATAIPTMAGHVIPPGSWASFLSVTPDAAPAPGARSAGSSSTRHGAAESSIGPPPAGGLPAIAGDVDAPRRGGHFQRRRGVSSGP